MFPLHTFSTISDSITIFVTTIKHNLDKDTLICAYHVPSAFPDVPRFFVFKELPLLILLE